MYTHPGEHTSLLSGLVPCIHPRLAALFGTGQIPEIMRTNSPLNPSAVIRSILLKTGVVFLSTIPPGKMTSEVLRHRSRYVAHANLVQERLKFRKIIHGVISGTARIRCFNGLQEQGVVHPELVGTQDVLYPLPLRLEATEGLIGYFVQ
jgi:hypothetical protein